MDQINIRRCGFVILCPERNLGGLQATARTVEANFPTNHRICVTGQDATAGELAEFGQVLPTHQAGTTHASLLNLGLELSRSDWTLFVMAGMTVRKGMLRNYERFAHSDRSVLFPVINRRWVFDEASIHGLMIHRAAFTDVGRFDEAEDDFRTVKLLWAAAAVEKGYQFLALVGVPR